LGAVVHDDRWTRIGLVNNAAITGPLGPLEKLSPAELMAVYAVNTTAPIWLMGFVARTAVAGVPIRFVNISSGAATHGVPGLSAYGSSKAALRLAGMAFIAESARPPRGQAKRDMAILSYEPGVVETPMQVHARGRSVESFPWVDLFHKFQSDGIVVEPRAVTSIIAEFLESDPVERFVEKRHGG
jgi:benzil reductase ((S)-benzoin forming)